MASVMPGSSKSTKLRKNATGNHPSLYASQYCIMRASQKAGSESDTVAIISVPESNHEPRNLAVSTPRGTAMTIHITTAIADKAAVVGSRVRMACVTGWPVTYDCPKSPCANWSQVMLKADDQRIVEVIFVADFRAMTSGVALGPAITCATSPGTTLINRNVKTPVASSVMNDQKIRRRSRRIIGRSTHFRAATARIARGVTPLSQG